MLKIIPNIEFIKELSKDSNSPLKQCMQCGTCSVICKLSPAEKPFPRKEMIWAGWGLKDKLLSDPDIWLCLQCGDCTTTCPRGVKPGDVLASIRNFSYLHYARPKFLAKLLSKPKYLPVVIAIPVIIILTIIYFAGTLTIPEGIVNYSKFFPHLYLNISFSILLFLMIIGMIKSIKVFRNDLKKNTAFKKHKNSLFKCFTSSIKEILTHEKFNKCRYHKYRYYTHLMVFWGFIILLIVTIFAIIAVVFLEYPLSLWNPVKIASNFAAVLLFSGLTVMIYNRIVNKDIAGNSNYTDWVFLISIYLLVISGVFVEIARFQNWMIAYYLYTLHLILVWFVIIYTPYTKFGHFIYRTIAMTYAKYVGRE